MNSLYLDGPLPAELCDPVLQSTSLVRLTLRLPTKPPVDAEAREGMSDESPGVSFGYLWLGCDVVPADGREVEELTERVPR